MRPNRFLASAVGFTLIEVVVAISLFGLLLGALYTTFSGTVEAWRRAEARADMEQNLRAATKLLAKDLENLVPGPDAMLTGVGADETTDERGALQMVTAPDQLGYGAAVEVIYQVTDAGLTRRVLPPPALQKTSNETLEPYVDEVVAPMVTRMQPRFLVDGEWQDEMSTEATSLPQAVEVTIWVGTGAQSSDERSRTITVNPGVGLSIDVGESATSGGAGAP